MIEQLNQEFGITDALRFEHHSSGLVRGVVNTSVCTGGFFLLGAHLAEFQPRCQKHPVLFSSREAVYEVGKPIRGGVPICFPWFGPNASDPTAPAHGLVRTQLWHMAESHLDGQVLVVQLGLQINEFDLSFQIRFGQQLSMNLRVTNRGRSEVSCEAALHTYFSIGSLSHACVQGLETLPFYDKVSQTAEPATGFPISFEAETDRVYTGEVVIIKLQDPGHGRTISLKPYHSRSTVVWNPWIEKSKRLADFGDDEYLNMCCIETANVGDQKIVLQPEKSASLAVEISVS